MFRVLKSTELAVVLCLALAVSGIAGSLLYQGNTAFGKQGPYNVFRSPFFLVPACLLLLNIMCCAGSRLAAMRLDRPRTWTFGGIHLGLLLMASGLILDGSFGVIGTKYFYVGVPGSSYFDWRKNREAALPFTVEIASLENRYHPLNIQVEVRDPAGKGLGVYTVREGISFAAGQSGLVVTPRRFDLASKTLFLDAAVDGRSASGMAAKHGEAAGVGGYSISPVAYADPEPSEQIAKVRFTLPGRNPEEREIRINGPARYGGLSFCLVAAGADKYGNPYAGLQMTREPGEWFFWCGAVLFALSIICHFAARKPSAEAPDPSGREPGGRGSGASGMVAGALALCLIGLFPRIADAFGKAIDGETTWEGDVRVAEPVTVEKGAILRIRPGTTVRMSGEEKGGNGCRNGYLMVFGTLRIEGEADRPVRFVRMHPDKAWEEIFLQGATASIRHAVFEGANWGLHIHGGNVSVERSEFLGNGGGARLKGTGAVFSRCTFRGNGVGIRFWDGGPHVSASIIEGNGTGLFYREGTGGGKIRGNRIANVEWNLKIGDWAHGDLDVSGNFWGGGGNGPANRGIGDFRDVKGRGGIVLLPVLSSPPDPCGAGEREER